MATSQPPTPRLPMRSDFPPSLTIDVVPPSSPSLNQQRPSVLLLLHGFGDNQEPFTTLGRALNLPNTTVLSLRGPSPVPAIITGSDTPSFHWGNDILFSPASDGIDLDAGFDAAAHLLWKIVIADVLRAACGLSNRDVLLWGVGQGAMAALAIAAVLPDIELGGVVAIGARVPATIPRLAAAAGTNAGAGKARTPILLLGGSASRVVTRSAVDDVKARFADVEYVRWAKADDCMPKNREEMIPIMRFLVWRLRREEGAGGGVGPGAG